MSWTCSRASAIALSLASAARVIVDTPELRENGVHPIPTIAVLSLIACSGMFTSFRKQGRHEDLPLNEFFVIAYLYASYSVPLSFRPKREIFLSSLALPQTISGDEKL